MLISLVAFLLLDTQVRSLPDPTQLRSLAIQNMRRAAQAVERYSCTTETLTEELDSDGKPKKANTERADHFYVNGVRVTHVLARNGKTLTGRDAEKEQSKTDREVQKYSKAAEAQKVEDKREQQFEMFLRAHRLLNGRRLVRNNRDTLQYELQADPQFHPHSVEERFAQAAAGNVVLDEQTGALVEIELHTTRDVKLVSGLLADLHKGFQLHAICERQPDGLWMAKLVEGNADVRAGLFFHPRIHFREWTSGCHLFSVDSYDTVHTAESKINQ